MSDKIILVKNDNGAELKGIVQFQAETLAPYTLLYLVETIFLLNEKWFQVL